MEYFDKKNSDFIEEQFSHIESLYFNSAYFGPGPAMAKQHTQKALNRELDPSFYAYNDYMQIPDRLRVKLGNFLSCSPEHIAHSTSVTDIIGILANGVSLEDHQHVVSFKGEYPSNILPWMLAREKGQIKNFSILDAPLNITVEWLQAHLPEHTKVLNLSHIAFNTGRKIDISSIGKFCREKDILLVVDVTQSLGGLFLDPETELAYIDVMACASYKWMLGPYGHAFAYFSQRALDTIKPFTANWIAGVNSKNVYGLLDYTTDSLPGARKFDRGQTPNMLAMAFLDGALDFFNHLSLQQITLHNQSLAQYFLDHYPHKRFDLITPLNARGNILCLRLRDGDTQTLESTLKEKNIDVSIREGNLRLSFHVYNTLEQVQTLLNLL